MFEDKESWVQAAFDEATPDDVTGLLSLYRAVYGAGYALSLGTDPVVMAAEIASPDTTWLVAREHGTGRIVGSIVASVDAVDRLGKLQGLVVHPDCRGSGLGDRAVALLAGTLLADGRVDSVYGTARTTSTAPQRICLRNGFHALGLFPNLRRARRHETMVLLVRYRDGVLDNRHPVQRVPAALGRLVAAVDESTGVPSGARVVHDDHAPRATSSVAATRMEVVDAPSFVLRRFREVLTDPVRRFYPFHTPNVLISPEDGGYELYAHLSRSDGYCTLIGAAPNALAVTEHLDELIAHLADAGASYLETLVPLDAYDELCALLAHGFFPAAAYPAMRRDGDRFRDHVVMARTMHPLDFQGLAIDAAFRPFAEQYIDLWTNRHLDTSGVFR